MCPHPECGHVSGFGVCAEADDIAVESWHTHLGTKEVCRWVDRLRRQGGEAVVDGRVGLVEPPGRDTWRPVPECITKEEVLYHGRKQGGYCCGLMDIGEEEWLGWPWILVRTDASIMRSTSKRTLQCEGEEQSTTTRFRWGRNLFVCWVFCFGACCG